MNGLSDVRLTLHSQELEAGQEKELRSASFQTAPACLSRWDLFWHRLHTRRVLLELTPEQLRDIGISRQQAREEGLKPFWRG
ncbi:DUF1127 domain-containing protein [Pseudomonas mediterranea]|uniref:Uncharacterized conserved protein YjiS, DUF1127 family n=1 Tax=Pseudomonas mediterranea TaxID=183795 RepID=A0AAX2D6T2_9PSED|nr:DUF1127 domain-containing protein [Pseudomonas mediterranea]KGU83853.1 hypothetical protein N005_18810 [Pseudomonas mediterranea CFBP 5447]MBL0842760.1 DUF1127 domain-containing protein [Pseudomonas mediterranea]UZE00863.1 DUF1127 domain-containing protein [Pseudomonas mediterranea]CAH0248072.1 hypothetical protein SRABI112_03046 [Pseudomonas mediterranea]SDU17668.1 Uncharacterized conserved protein YjiS, DUF1127 family [Pseudomonas mediterranea]